VTGSHAVAIEKISSHWNFVIFQQAEGPPYGNHCLWIDKIESNELDGLILVDMDLENYDVQLAKFPTDCTNRTYPTSDKRFQIPFHTSKYPLPFPSLIDTKMPYILLAIPFKRMSCPRNHCMAEPRIEYAEDGSRNLQTKMQAAT
jgi:hypothetical protein